MYSLIFHSVGVVQTQGGMWTSAQSLHVHPMMTKFASRGPLHTLRLKVSFWLNQSDKAVGRTLSETRAVTMDVNGKF